jgi:hypothetical protein
MLSNRNVALLLSLCVSCGGASAQLVVSSVPPPVLGFLDISGTGTAIPNVGDDTEHLIVTTVGNELFPAGNVLVSSNGVAISGITSGSVGFTNSAASQSSVGSLLPLGGRGYLLPFWDDLQSTDGSANTTIYWQEIGGVLYIMWKDIGHFPQVAGQVVTFELQVFSSHGGCTPGVQFLYADTTFGGTQASADSGASATVGYIGGTLTGTGQFSLNAASVPTGTTVSVTESAANLTASSPFGPGSIQLIFSQSACSDEAATYVLAVTLTTGLTPGGWLFGLDIPVTELAAEIAAGAPFVGPLVGSAVIIGPFGGLPSIPVNAVALGFDALGTLSAHSTVLQYVIP